MVVSSVPFGAMGGLRRRVASVARRIDPLMLSVLAAICALGVLMVYSSTRVALEEAGLDPTSVMKRQVAFALIGVIVMISAAVIDYRELRRLSGPAYVLVIFLLLLVLSPVGAESKGAQAWFQFGSFQLQPSELAKPAIIVVLAAYLGRFRGRLDLRFLLFGLLLGAVPTVLIIAQPDPGTALVFLAVIAAMVLVAGARSLHLLLLAMIGVASITGVLQADLLKDYQQARLTAFLDQSEDPTVEQSRAAYNLEQSRIAIGAGGLTGRGLFDGSQTNLSYVPEQHTDFIFTAVGEQLGFVGAATLLGLFAVLIWRIWAVGQLARDMTGTLICAGVMAMLVFHVFQNVGMSLGIMPITGIPLPFVSHGGSAMIGAFAAIGLVINVRLRSLA